MGDHSSAGIDVHIGDAELDIELPFPGRSSRHASYVSHNERVNHPGQFDWNARPIHRPLPPSTTIDANGRMALAGPPTDRVWELRRVTLFNPAAPATALVGTAVLYVGAIPPIPGTFDIGAIISTLAAPPFNWTFAADQVVIYPGMRIYVDGPVGGFAATGMVREYPRDVYGLESAWDTDSAKEGRQHGAALVPVSH